MSDIQTTEILFNCLDSLRNMGDDVKDEIDRCGTAVSKGKITPVTMQVICSEYQDSRVKIVWVNQFAAKYDMDFLQFIKDVLRMYL